jgi:hypothetical protein
MRKLLLLFLISIILLKGVYASGYSMSPLENNILPMYLDDKSRMWVVTLQNGENKSMSMTITQTDGFNISQLMNESVQILPPYTYDREVYFNITLPPKAKIGDEWRIGFSVASHDAEPNQGMVAFDQEVSGHFTVKVIKNPDAKSFKYLYIIVPLAIVILLVSIILIFRSRRKTQVVTKNPIQSDDDFLKGLI